MEQIYSLYLGSSAPDCTTSTTGSAAPPPAPRVPMKRGSSVLQPACDAASRRSDGEHSSEVAGSSPFPAATSLFSPDVGAKMASDLLIRLSEATQKAQVHPGRREEAEQQDEPGPALSPDGPGASPEPPCLTHTPNGNASAAAAAASAAGDTLASDLLRKLAERQEENGVAVRLKEEEEPMEVDAMVQNRPIAEKLTPPTLKVESRHFFAVKAEEDRGLRGAKMAEQLCPGAKMADRWLLGQKIQEAGSQTAGSDASGLPFGVKIEDDGVSGVSTKIAERPFSGSKMEDELPSGARMENLLASGAKTEEQPLFFGAKMEEPPLFFGAKMEEPPLFFGAKMEEQQLLFGAKMEEHCLRAALWQDMSVNLASTLLHQLSERAGKASSQQPERMAPPTRNSPATKVRQLRPSPDPPHEPPSRDHRSAGSAFFFRCHVCGFETEGHTLFQSHMTEHRQWERGSFSLHCCACELSTNQEAEMRAHLETHLQGDSGETSCPGTRPAAAAAVSSSSSGCTLAVAVATQPESSGSEHRCRICQRSFPGQQELLVHFQGHRQGNQYRCDRCGHLTRTANKLVEHVRVHTGERPFTCDLCPYSAKRRDSLRLHRKVKHGAAAAAATTTAAQHVHTHRSYVHGDNQRSNKHVQRLHTPPRPSPASSSGLPLHPLLPEPAGWRELSPLLPITTLLSLKPRCSSSSSSSFFCSSSSSSSSSFFCSSSSSSSSLPAKHSFLSYLGLKTL